MRPLLFGNKNPCFFPSRFDGKSRLSALSANLVFITDVMSQDYGWLMGAVYSLQYINTWYSRHQG